MSLIGFTAIMARWPTTLFALWIALATLCQADEADLPSLEEPARLLQASTLTVRVWNPMPEFAADASPLSVEESLGPRRDEVQNGVLRRVTVCSGVAVGTHLVVTPIYAASDSQIRITLPDGGQAKGTVRVIDEYSGLTLLETEGMPLQAIQISLTPPRVGQWVVGAAAWGAESPLVLLGSVAGTDRTLPGAAYPPLLQCDLRTTETSSGAGVVDRTGRLIGVVVAAEEPSDGQSWTFAVPVRHVQRLLRTMQEATSDQSVVVLKRLRPTVGMVLDSDDQTVFVSRVESGSPAEKAGIQVGDHVLAVDGTRIRSVYQAVRPVLIRQPGDEVEFLLNRDGDVWAAPVVLAGGVELPSAPFANLARIIRPKLDLEALEGGVVASRDRSGTLHEVFAPPVAEQADSSLSKIELLEKALDRYQQAIVYLQNRLQREQAEREEMESLLDALRTEIESIKDGVSEASD